MSRLLGRQPSACTTSSSQRDLKPASATVGLQDLCQSHPVPSISLRLPPRVYISSVCHTVIAMSKQMIQLAHSCPHQALGTGLIWQLMMGAKVLLLRVQQA